MLSPAAAPSTQLPTLATLRTLPREGRDTLFLLAVIAWLLLPQAGRLPLWCSLGAGAVLLWRGWLALNARALPRKAWLVLLLALTMGATYATHGTLIGRDAGVTLLVVLLTLKTLELRARRDAFVIFFLGFFCMLSNFFYSQSLLTACSMVLGLLGLLTALVNAHMPVGKPPLAQAARTAGSMALLGAPIMLVLFMLFPRMAPLWGVPSDAMTGRSGLSARMEVGTMATLALDDSVAMRIRFEGEPPPQREMYFRGPVLSSFDGRQWLPLNSSQSPVHALPANLQASGEPVHYEVTLEPTQRPWLFVMEAALQRPEVPGYRNFMEDDLQWLTSRPITELVRYKVSSYPAFTHGPAQPMRGLQEYVDLPPGFNPRTLALAAEIRRDPRNAKATTAGLVQVALERLRTGGYTYTLEPGVYGRDTADEFWFDRKEGFCEHIASSFVILMRALDIPARIVTGYQGGERNGVDGFWVVRQSDAHAWAEVWQAGRGWVRVDPTSAVAPGRTGAFQRLAAPRGAVAQAFGNFSPTLSAQFRATWEAINNGWNQWVLNYTQGKQLSLLKNIGFETPDWLDLTRLLIGALVLASIAGGGWAWWERSQHDPWLRLLGRARKRLAQAGIESTPATSPRQLARQVLQQYGDQGQALHDWLVQLEVQRYAPTAQTARPSTPLKSHVRQLDQLRQQFSRLRWPA
ncbi:transglutaminase family protein [Polaromonas naphthalenivorans]|uniref:Transglutaminase domain protein n=1 Tax=Polaromonas naphthalenivorans (strain CJ2) TaxID=365044 RepID=A1VLK4_POLNA|nr:transglutaminaseTgpA domain-containing protein [Polaromonas naphthalenivorans]ABM36532.1 transglutaminase domain protein [Polaromonas naphthalenivorans CJ2]